MIITSMLLGKYFIVYCCDQTKCGYKNESEWLFQKDMEAVITCFNLLGTFNVLNTLHISVQPKNKQCGS